MYNIQFMQYTFSIMLAFTKQVKCLWLAWKPNNLVGTIEFVIFNCPLGIVKIKSKRVSMSQMLLFTFTFPLTRHVHSFLKHYLYPEKIWCIWIAEMSIIWALMSIVMLRVVYCTCWCCIRLIIFRSVSFWVFKNRLYVLHEASLFQTPRL